MPQREEAMTVQQKYERFVATDATELWQRVDVAQERFFQLARSIGPDVVGTGTVWSTRDVVAHLLTVMERYTNRDIRSREGLGDTPRAVDALNDLEMRPLVGVSMDELLVRLKAQMDRIREAFSPESIDLHERYPFHGGITVDAAGGVANLMGEFLVHGYDLATAAGRPWPITPRDGLLINNLGVQVMPAYRRPAAKGALDLLWRIPGAADWVIAFDNGRVVSRPADAGERVDVIMTAPPETLLLFMYQRIGPVAALRRGLRVSGGRRPWRIAKLQKFMEKP
jgi:uncharacterized protein (TIGR03083 family)